MTTGPRAVDRQHPTRFIAEQHEEQGDTSVKVFLSWSGDLSLDMATVLRDWLPCVIQTLRPYVSAKDIHKGDRWLIDVSKELERAAFGILCVTPDNLEKPWLHFEAGALSKSVDAARVIPFLLGVNISDVQGPLAQFQAASVEQDEVRDLLISLNGAAEAPLADSVLESSFAKWWPELEAKLVALSKRAMGARQQQGMPVGPSRTNDQIAEILDRVLEAVRSQQSLLRAIAEAISPKQLQESIRVMLRGEDRPVVPPTSRKRWRLPEMPAQLALTLRQARAVAATLRLAVEHGSFRPVSEVPSRSLPDEATGLMLLMLEVDDQGRVCMTDAGIAAVSSVERLVEGTDIGDDEMVWITTESGLVEVSRKLG